MTKGHGHLIIGGGALEASRNKVFARFLKEAGGIASKIVVIAVSSSEPLESFGAVAKALTGLGLPKENLSCVPLTLVSELLSKGWTDKADDKLLPYFQEVSGVWFTGGDQLKTVKSLIMENGEDSPVLSAVRTILAGGGVIGGTSAGAAVMSSKMIARGSDEGVLNYPVCTEPDSYTEEFEEQERLLLMNGLGFFTEGIIDQHFNKRPRLQRLMCALRYLNENVGYGISEDTALCVSLQDQKKEVIGSGYVMKVEYKDEGSFLTNLLS